MVDVSLPLPSAGGRYRLSDDYPRTIPTFERRLNDPHVSFPLTPPRQIIRGLARGGKVRGLVLGLTGKERSPPRCRWRVNHDQGPPAALAPNESYKTRETPFLLLERKARKGRPPSAGRFELGPPPLGWDSIRIPPALLDKASFRAGI